MCYEEVDKKKINSSRFLIKVLTELGFIIDAYASTFDCF